MSIYGYRHGKWTMRKDYKNVNEIIFDEDIGWLQVFHDGNVSWDTLQEIKNDYFGKDSVAIEVYPPEDRVINHCNCRHLWRLGKGEFYPDLRDGEGGDTLAERLSKARGEVLDEIWYRRGKMMNEALSKALKVIDNNPKTVDKLLMEIGMAGDDDLRTFVQENLENMVSLGLLKGNWHVGFYI